MTYIAYGVAIWLLVIGLYGMVTSRHLVNLCICLAIVQASTYVMLAAIGYRPGGTAPILTPEVRPETPKMDPVVQALMLTDIVVEATVVALLLAITVEIGKKTGNVDPDDVDLMRG
jgi:multicomponent Na+:H+ antiporter subunit C